MNNAREQGLDRGDRETFQSKRAVWGLGSFLPAAGLGPWVQSVSLRCSSEGVGSGGPHALLPRAGDSVWSSTSCSADSLHGALSRHALRVTGQAPAGR